jgi:hypothetical protein
MIVIPEGLIGKTKFNVHNPDFDFMDPRYVITGKKSGQNHRIKRGH